MGALHLVQSGWFHLAGLLRVILYVLVHTCTLLAVPSWRGWSHDLTEGRPSAAPGNCLQERERERDRGRGREKRECQAELKMREGCWGVGEKLGMGGLCGGVAETREATVKKRIGVEEKYKRVIQSSSS